MVLRSQICFFNNLHPHTQMQLITFIVPMHLTSIVTTIIISLLLSTILPLSYCEEPQPPVYINNDPFCKAQPYNCKPLSNISYPFWGHNRPSYCGGGDSFNLNCHQHDNHNTTTILIGSQNFTVLHINTTASTMRLKRTDLAQDVCSPKFEDTSLSSPNSSTVFRYNVSVYNISIFYNCSSAADISFAYFKCRYGGSAIFVGGEEEELLKEYPWLQTCRRHTQVPVDAPSQNYRDGGLSDLIGIGFPVIYTVVTDHKSNTWNWKRKIIIGVTIATIGILSIGITVYCFRFKSSTWKRKFRLRTNSNQNIEAFLKNQGALLPLKRYKFSHVKKMTDSFRVTIGKGGFGVVYKGKLLNGCLVAVKLLNQSKKNNEEFINEVASISKTSHVNVVTLLGFCLEGNKKALIYEFMPNGSLEKFIYGKEHDTNNIVSLSWEKLYQISLGIARGLEYLHKGCNTRILHLDIKPHNILLDENFCPKISDFGLAKLDPRKQSIISMSGARGTMGYVAPEVWNRHIGGVSHKSDVYSYGMMLLEMVGGRKNINAEAIVSSEIYFPHWVYNRLELDSNLRPNEIMAIEENEIARRMTIVGLWCIQTFPNDRPTMSRLIEMLQGNINSLEIPPKPMLSSPTRSVSESSTS